MARCRGGAPRPRAFGSAGEWLGFGRTSFFSSFFFFWWFCLYQANRGANSRKTQKPFDWPNVHLGDESAKRGRHSLLVGCTLSPTGPSQEVDGRRPSPIGGIELGQEKDNLFDCKKHVLFVSIVVSFLGTQRMVIFLWFPVETTKTGYPQNRHPCGLFPSA